MHASVAIPSTRRVAVRRAVALECAVTSNLWDECVPLLASDLSPFGMFVDSGLALDVGEEVVLSFRPPGWPGYGWPVTALAEVVRVSLGRRKSDSRPAGMGLRFTELEELERERMGALLQGLPPPLPRPRPEPEEDAVMVVDGVRFELVAEGELLSATRPSIEVVQSVSPRVVSRAKHRANKRLLRPSRRPVPTSCVSSARPPRLRLVG